MRGASEQRRVLCLEPWTVPHAVRKSDRIASLRVLPCVLTLLVLAACTAGPDFVGPQPAPPADYAPASQPGATQSTPGGGESQFFLVGEDLPRGWWHWFDSPAIVRLVERAFASSPDLGAARARLRRAEAQLRAQRGLLLPEVGASGSLSYGSGGFDRDGQELGQPGQQPGDGSGGEAGSDEPFTVYTADATISYDFDLAGRNRRLIEAALAEVERQQQELQAAYLALIGNIVSAAVESASLRAQIAAREELLEGQNERLELLRIRVEEGADARADLVVVLTEIAGLRATLPPLRTELAASDNRLALLIGEPPAGAGIPRIELAELRLPRTVPITVPSRLVRTRPDILAAEAVLARTSAQIGVEAADLYPNVTLDAALGIGGGAGGIGIGSLMPFFDIGGGLLAPLFDGGRRSAERDAAVAAYQEALALYREQVLTAFVEVANGIRALENGAVALIDRRIALEAAEESLDLARFRLSEGAISVIDVLVLQQQYEEARFAYLDAVATRFQDTAALFAALGPGPLDDSDLAGIVVREHLGTTRTSLDAGRVPEEGW